MLTIFDYIEKHALNKKVVALVDGETIYSYHCLHDIIIRNRSELGYKHRQKLYIVKEAKQIDYIIAFLTLLSLECWVVPVSNNVTDDELKAISDHTKASVFQMPDFSLSSASQQQLPLPQGDLCGILHMTSGSTSTPKFCIRTLDALTAEGLNYHETFSLCVNDKLLCLPPLTHSFALGAALMAGLMSGASIYLMDKFIPRKACSIVTRENITVILLVPIMAKLICDMYNADQYDFVSVRIALVGAGPITKKLYYDFFNRYGIPLLSNYGSTETGGLVSRLTSYPYESIGQAMSRTTIKIANCIGEEVPIGIDGEVWARSDSMMIGYLGGQRLSPDQYWPMGDLAMQDHNGFLYLRGRRDFEINIGGKKVNPEEVEEAILQHSDVNECAIMGIKRTSGEEALHAFVAAKTDLTQTQIRLFLKEKLSEYKIPTSIHFLPYLPKKETGKIDRAELAKQIPKY